MCCFLTACEEPALALSDIQVALEGGLSDEVPHAGGSLLVVIGSDCTQ